MFNFCGWLHRKFLIRLAGKVLENQLKPGNINKCNCISWHWVFFVTKYYYFFHIFKTLFLSSKDIVSWHCSRVWHNKKQDKLLKLNQGFSNHNLPTLSQHLSQVNVAEIYQYRDGSSHPQFQLSVGDRHRISKASILLKLSSSVAM